MSINLEEKLIRAIKNHGLDILTKVSVDEKNIEKYLQRIYNEHLNYPIPRSSTDITNWLIPADYKNMDIEDYLISICPIENSARLQQELDLYRKKQMIPVLKTMKYIIDTLRSNSIVWGVGRGSSVASYVLFLLGVHKIDSVKYNLPIEEFFKEI